MDQTACCFGPIVELSEQIYKWVFIQLEYYFYFQLKVSFFNLGCVAGENVQKG